MRKGHAAAGLCREALSANADCSPENIYEFVRTRSEHDGADVAQEVTGGPDTFRLVWQYALPNAIVTVVALYDRPQTLPLPDMYGKNLIQDRWSGRLQVRRNSAAD